ncbi:LacI family DNA-binding transcriptional regulator [Salinicoccus sp. RF5]|uniref:LacI family DNA-binding transcriptional regulator n=1 Tax=Salinicoccus sp. RF5 TaxID=2748874 RepID=UPI001E58ABF9|nr:LacI family DNA-binding transcriptional regulator [Salinicoccus sp. RF5]MCC4722320.1 LacI family transcriptional regulator [Salinicoccus sp. RF5]
MVTLKDLAAEIGVSVATVSRALNSSGYASPEVKKRVLEAAKRLNYKPNEVARALNTSRSNIIGVLVPDISNPYFPKMIRGIEDAAMKNNYRIIIGNTDHDLEKESKYLEVFDQNNCAGIISATWSSSRDEILGRPLILLDRVVEDHISVESDNMKGGRLQATHLIQQGADRILIIKGPQNYSSFNKRTLGAEEILQAKDVFYKTVDYDEMDRKMTHQNIDFLMDVNGIVCPNDLVAYRILNALVDHGISVPEKVKVIGFDNLDFSQYVHPSLTTIEQPVYELGALAFKMLQKLNEGGKVESQVMDVKLIKRKST